MICRSGLNEINPFRDTVQVKCEIDCPETKYTESSAEGGKSQWNDVYR